MKLPFFLAVLLVSFASTAFAHESALLTWSHHGGFIAPPLRDRTCAVYERLVVLTGNGQIFWRRPLRFSAEVPGIANVYQLLRQVRRGALIQIRGVPNDVGESEYRAVYPTSTLLLREGFPRGVRNTAPAAEALVRFLDLNCR